MPKIVAHYAKKLPTGEYSNETFSASIEAEIASASPETAREALRRLFQTVRGAVDEQFAGGQRTAPLAGHATPAPNGPRANGHRNISNGGQPAARPMNGNGRHVPATQSQKKAVYAIAKSLGIDPAQYDTENLSVKAASNLIDELKSQQTTR